MYKNRRHLTSQTASCKYCEKKYSSSYLNCHERFENPKRKIFEGRVCGKTLNHWSNGSFPEKSHESLEILLHSSWARAITFPHCQKKVILHSAQCNITHYTSIIFLVALLTSLFLLRNPRAFSKPKSPTNTLTYTNVNQHSWLWSSYAVVKRHPFLNIL